MDQSRDQNNVASSSRFRSNKDDGTITPYTYNGSSDVDYQALINETLGRSLEDDNDLNLEERRRLKILNEPLYQMFFSTDDESSQNFRQSNPSQVMEETSVHVHFVESNTNRVHQNADGRYELHRSSQVYHEVSQISMVDEKDRKWLFRGDNNQHNRSSFHVLNVRESRTLYHRMPTIPQSTDRGGMFNDATVSGFNETRPRESNPMNRQWQMDHSSDMPTNSDPSYREVMKAIRVLQPLLTSQQENDHIKKTTKPSGFEDINKLLMFQHLFNAQVESSEMPTSVDPTSTSNRSRMPNPRLNSELHDEIRLSQLLDNSAYNRQPVHRKNVEDSSWQFDKKMPAFSKSSEQVFISSKSIEERRLSYFNIPKVNNEPQRCYEKFSQLSQHQSGLTDSTVAKDSSQDFNYNSYVPSSSMSETNHGIRDSSRKSYPTSRIGKRKFVEIHKLDGTKIVCTNQPLRMKRSFEQCQRASGVRKLSNKRKSSKCNLKALGDILGSVRDKKKKAYIVLRMSESEYRHLPNLVTSSQRASIASAVTIKQEKQQYSGNNGITEEQSEIGPNVRSKRETAHVDIDKQDDDSVLKQAKDDQRKSPTRSNHSKEGFKISTSSQWSSVIAMNNSPELNLQTSKTPKSPKLITLRNTAKRIFRKTDKEENKNQGPNHFMNRNTTKDELCNFGFSTSKTTNTDFSIYSFNCDPPTPIKNNKTAYECVAKKSLSFESARPFYGSSAPVIKPAEPMAEYNRYDNKYLPLSKPNFGFEPSTNPLVMTQREDLYGFGGKQNVLSQDVIVNSLSLKHQDYDRFSDISAASISLAERITINIVALIILPLVLVMTFLWTTKRHAVFLVAAIIVLNGLASLIFRMGWGMGQKLLVLFHTILHHVALLLLVVGIASGSYSDIKTPGENNLHSMHFWIGIFALILYFFQYVTGWLSLIFFKLFAPIHAAMGVVTYAIAVGACLTGITEVYMTNSKMDPAYTNNLGLTIIISACVVIYTLAQFTTDDT